MTVSEMKHFNLVADVRAVNEANRNDYSEALADISIEWPVVQLKPRADLDIAKLFEGLEDYIHSCHREGMGEERSILFENANTSHWFFAYDTVPSSGVILEAQGQSTQDLVDAYHEIIELLNIKPSRDLDWVSEYILETSDSNLSCPLPKFQSHKL